MNATGMMGSAYEEDDLGSAADTWNLQKLFNPTFSTGRSNIGLGSYGIQSHDIGPGGGSNPMATYEKFRHINSRMGGNYD